MVWLCVEKHVGDMEFAVGADLQQLLVIVVNLAEAEVPEAVWPGVVFELSLPLKSPRRKMYSDSSVLSVVESKSSFNWFFIS